ncbi:MAG: lysophospholipid acyltransferase family protein [Pacificimonas sp.]
MPLALLAMLLVPPNWVIRKLFPDRQPWLPKPFHRLMCWACGVTVKAHGRRATGTVLYVANHVSWVDIMALGSLLRARFVAKSELGEGGALGFFCDQQRTIYIDRGKARDAGAQANILVDALRAGDSLILFPEGTTSDGRRPLPFKSSLLNGLTDGTLERVRVQPVSVAFTRVRSMPAFRGRFPQLAWVGDYDIGESVMQILRLRSVRMDIVFHEPLAPEDFGNRKTLTAELQRIVDGGYRQAMHDYVRPA